MSRWIRLHQSALHNPKLVTLSDRQYRAWTNCLLMADVGDGSLPKIRDIACHLRMSIQDAELILSELVEVDLIDMSVIDGVRTFKMHDWNAHQYVSDSSVERTRKYRKNIKEKTRDGDVTACDASRDGDVTPPDPDPDPDTETDTENKLQLSEQVAAREAELGFNLGLKKTGSRKGEMETLQRQAEGLGLDVAELLAITNRNRPKKREGYFSTLCVNRLKDQLPGLDEQIIRDALNGKHEHYKTVCALLVGTVQ